MSFANVLTNPPVDESVTTRNLTCLGPDRSGAVILNGIVPVAIPTVGEVLTDVVLITPQSSPPSPGAVPFVFYSAGSFYVASIVGDTRVCNWVLMSRE